jgi:hypothetical protein
MGERPNFRFTLGNVSTGGGTATVSGPYKLHDPSNGDQTSGTVTFTERAQGGRMLISVIDLAPSLGGSSLSSVLNQLLSKGG